MTEPCFPALEEALLCLAVERAGLKSVHDCIIEEESLPIRQSLSLLSHDISRQAFFLSAWHPQTEKAEEQALDYALLSLEAVSALAQRMEPGPVRQVLDFLLPEYLDALYRVANLLALRGTDPLSLTGGYSEIMPGRPLYTCRRSPVDGVESALEGLSLWEEMALSILLSLEEEKTRFFQRAAAQESESLGRGLFLEMCLLSDQYAVEFASLLPHRSGMARLALNRYAACFLYASLAEAGGPSELVTFAEQAEKNAIAQFQSLLQFIPEQGGVFPEPPALPPLVFGRSKTYVRDILEKWGRGEQWNSESAGSVRYQKAVCPDPAQACSCQIIDEMIRRTGTDYRFEIAPHPIEALRDRTKSQRIPGA